jgi:hypothetical protein
MHSPAIAECRDIFRPAKPNSTIPASGKVRGIHGERLSALRSVREQFLQPVFGPEVLNVTVTVGGGAAAVPAAICVGLKAQLTVASGSPLHAKVTALRNVEPLPAVTVKVEVVGSPASVLGLLGVGVDTVKI